MSTGKKTVSTATEVFQTEDGRLCIILPLTGGKLSSTQKSMVVASTGGYTKSDVVINGQAVRVSVNGITDVPAGVVAMPVDGPGAPIPVGRATPIKPA